MYDFSSIFSQKSYIFLEKLPFKYIPNRQPTKYHTFSVQNLILGMKWALKIGEPWQLSLYNYYSLSTNTNQIPNSYINGDSHEVEQKFHCLGVHFL